MSSAPVSLEAFQAFQKELMDQMTRNDKAVHDKLDKVSLGLEELKKVKETLEEHTESIQKIFRRLELLESNDAGNAPGFAAEPPAKYHRGPAGGPFEQPASASRTVFQNHFDQQIKPIVDPVYHP
eukprot:7085908-Pyramimonas_sp.AAC.1